MRSLLNLVENLIGISQIVGMAWITKTLLDACMDVCWCVSRRRQQHIRNAVSILDSARAPVEREGNGRKVKNKKLQNWIHSRILITSNCRTIVSAWHYRNQRKSCSWWIRALEKKRAKNTCWLAIHTHTAHTHILVPIVRGPTRITFHLIIFMFEWTPRDVSVVRERCMRGIRLCRCVQIGNAIHYSPNLSSDTSNEAAFDSLLLLFFVPNFAIYNKRRTVRKSFQPIPVDECVEQASVSPAAQSLHFALLFYCVHFVWFFERTVQSTQDTLVRDVHCAAQKNSAETIRCYALIQFSLVFFFFRSCCNSFCLPLLLPAIHRRTISAEPIKILRIIFASEFVPFSKTHLIWLLHLYALVLVWDCFFPATARAASKE